jgi:hypothetical protein
MIERIIIAILTKLGTELITLILKNQAKKNKKAVSEMDVDKKLYTVKRAYKDVFDGKPATPQQIKETKNAIAHFLKSGPHGGL